MQYNVRLILDASYWAFVDAASVEEAKAKAFDQLCACNLGDLSMVQVRTSSVQDAEGTVVYERSKSNGGVL